jgi:peptidoglycan/xylan/chitin deacetylase (PgdA/CDA1 family)
MTKFKFAIILCLLLPFFLLSCPKQERLPPVLPPDARLVSLFFDDAWMNQYDVALPILLQHNFKASFAVITGSIGTGEGFWKYMGEKELKELAKYGMDIAAHTKSHPDLTANLTDAQLREEIIGSKKYLEKLGFEVRTFVAPYLKWNDTLVSYVVEAGYVCARGGWGFTYDLRTTDPKARFSVPSHSITDEDFETFKSIVAKASRDSVVVLVYHFISDIGPKETSTPVANFAAQMRYLKEGGFTVVLLPDLFR